MMMPYADASAQLIMKEVIRHTYVADDGTGLLMISRYFACIRYGSVLESVLDRRVKFYHSSTDEVMAALVALPFHQLLRR